MIKALVKANNDLISYCNCHEAFAYSAQLDCPWCGCGWLFTCIECRKAFTFAKVVLTKLTPDELARRELVAWGSNADECDPSEIAMRADWLISQTAPLKVGDVCIIIDGSVIPATARDLKFDGWFASHTFAAPPQVTALDNPSIIDATLGRTEYWTEREIVE